MSNRKVLLMGENPLAADVIRQYVALGREVVRGEGLLSSGSDIIGFDELFLLPAADGDPLHADYCSLALLAALADMVEPPVRKLCCHLMVRSPQTLQMLRATDFCEAISSRFDVYAFMLEDVWSTSIALDREAITYQSEQHVHLVVFGMSAMAELVAVNAALRAHYPNYVRNHSLRTRITMVDDNAQSMRQTLTARYPHLFDNSYYRTVRPSAQRPVTELHRPMYEGVLEDFVDVEWEFVQAPLGDALLMEKLKSWSADERQQLTVVLAHDDAQQNISQALLLPQALYSNAIPIYIYTRESVSFMKCTNIRLFGMADCGYDVTLPIVRMAKNINYVYDRCYADNVEHWAGQPRYAVEIDRDERERSWARLKNVKRASNVYNAMTIPVKLHSLGLEAEDWDKFYDISQRDLELLAQVEHNRWSVEELIMGWRPCTPDEQKAVEADIDQKEELKRLRIHYDLRAYDDLRADRTGKSSKIYDVCISACLPLIAKAFADEKGGGA